MAFAEISNVSGSNQTVLAAPATGYVNKIIRVHFTLDAAGIVTFSDGDASSGPPTTRRIYAKFTGAGGLTMDPIGMSYAPRPLFRCSGALKVTASAGNLYGIVEYETEPT